MIYKVVKNIIICSVLIMLLVQCKSSGFNVSNTESIGVPFTPTLVVDSCINEHQYEGKDSDILTRVEIAGEIKKIPQWAFAIIPTLEEVRLSPNVKTLDDNAFFSCKNLYKINLNDVDSIGENCFKFSALESVKLEKVRIIKEFAFSNCTSLKDIEFSRKLEKIGEFAFSGDTAIVSCKIPAGKIEAGAFMGCYNIEELSFGDVISIGKAAFLDCSSLTSVVIPSTVKEIDSEAFSGCKKLNEVILRSHDTKVAEDAFDKNVVITYKK